MYVSAINRATNCVDVNFGLIHSLRGRAPLVTHMLVTWTRWDIEITCDVSIWSRITLCAFFRNLPRDHKKSKCKFGGFFLVCVRDGGLIMLPAFALQLAHKLILNSRFGIPQLSVFVRNNLTRTSFIHRNPNASSACECVPYDVWELAEMSSLKARRLLNYSKLYHPNEMKHSALVLRCCKENKLVFFPPLLFLPSIRKI